jgi:hypothetical protein
MSCCCHIFCRNNTIVRHTLDAVGSSTVVRNLTAEWCNSTITFMEFFHRASEFFLTNRTIQIGAVWKAHSCVCSHKLRLGCTKKRVLVRAGTTGEAAKVRKLDCLDCSCLRSHQTLVRVDHGPNYVPTTVSSSCSC